MIPPEINPQIVNSVPDHQFLLSFNGDEDSRLFYEWFNNLGWDLFLEWTDNHHNNKERSSELL